MPYNQKSQPDGKCYRSVCKRHHDWQWNKSTEAYYCINCRILITRWPENKDLFDDHQFKINPGHKVYWLGEKGQTHEGIIKSVESTGKFGIGEAGLPPVELTLFTFTDGFKVATDNFDEFKKRYQ